MNISSILIVILVLVLVSLTIAWAILRSLRPSITKSLTPNSGTLNKENRIGGSGEVRDKFMAPPSSTLILYLQCALNEKTPTLNDGNNPIRILQLGNSLQLQIIPGSAVRKSETILMVKTQNENERISLMDFPQQKWVHTAIVREGRRYTVYYNGIVAGSSRTKYYPTINSSQFIIGDTRLHGSFAFPKLSPTAYHMKEVIQDMEATSDTRHRPYINSPTNSFFTGFSCPNGIFCFSTSSQPTLNPLKTWKSPYA